MATYVSKYKTIKIFNVKKDYRPATRGHRVQLYIIFIRIIQNDDESVMIMKINNSLEYCLEG